MKSKTNINIIGNPRSGKSIGAYETSHNVLASVGSIIGGLHYNKALTKSTKTNPFLVFDDVSWFAGALGAGSSDAFPKTKTDEVDKSKCILRWNPDGSLKEEKS